MPSTVEKLTPTRVKLTIEVPFADLQPSLDRVYQEVSQQVQVPGFRKGKVPARIIDQRFGRGAIVQDAISDYLPTAYVQALSENNMVPLGQPEIEVVKVDDGNLVEFTAELDIRPEFEVADISGLEVEVSSTKVEPAQIDEQVELLRERFATVTDVDRAAAKDDLVTIDLTAAADGKELADVAATDMTYRVGAEGFIEGLDKAVTGVKAGEEVTFATTLVGGEYAGTEADVTVKVKKVQNRELPEVDDEFAALVSQFDTVADMRIDLEQNLERMARLNQVTEARDKVLEYVVANTEFELPEKIITEEIEERKNAINSQLAAMGTTLEHYLSEMEEEAKTEAEFWENMTKRSEEALRGQLILDKLAEQKSVDITQKDLVELIYQKAMANGTSPEVELQHMMEHDHQVQWTQEARRGKALTELVADAVVKDTDGNVVEIELIQSDGSLADPADLADDPAEVDLPKDEESAE